MYIYIYIYLSMCVLFWSMLKHKKYSVKSGLGDPS